MIDQDETKRYWVGFNLVKGIGPARLRLLLEYFGDAASAWHAPRQGLEEAGLGPKLIDGMLQIREGNLLDKIWDKVQSQGISVLTWEDSSYPRRLKEIDQSPPVLYVRGNLLEEDHWAVAIVGTRRLTAYGRQVAQEIARELAKVGITIVSGLARGIDGVAHRAALEAGGRTLAVLGSGVDRIYPPEHRLLADQIVYSGALISDYAPGTPPEAANFPPRNRIISGLVLAVAVIEAGVKSGALITAAFAAEQGRELFAVPGTVYGPQSKGTNLLIHEGAHILLNAQNILEILNLAQASEYRVARTQLPANAIESRLFDLLGREPMHVDEIHSQLDLPIEEISANLTVMELKGLVRQVGSMRYIAVYERGQEYLVESEE